MKTFKKVLASTLAAAMVVTALPVTPANAAATPKLSTTKAAAYVGQSKTIKVTTPKTWKSVKVKATTSKKSVATAFLVFTDVIFAPFGKVTLIVFD